MTADGLLVVQTIFTTIWRILTSWYIPGTHVTPAAFALFCLICGAVIRLMCFILGIDKE